jgi:preprotein translocase subunit YajC
MKWKLQLFFLFISGGFVLATIAHAMAQGSAAAQQGGGPFGTLIPLIIMFVIFYFLLIRPQQKKTKEHREMVQNLKKGDRIITSGGIHGRITGMDEGTVTVEIADRVRIKVTRGNVAAKVSAEETSQTEKQ